MARKTKLRSSTGMTMIIYSSLNFKGGKRDIYEGGHRVPFLMRWPNAIKAGTKVDVPVCQTDYLATIADIIGVKLPV